jgi:hypothetical protein
LEYSTLAAMAARICEVLGSSGFDMHIGEKLAEIRELMQPFAEKAISLLLKERDYMNARPLSPLFCDDDEISRMRGELFGTAMSHGGEFKKLADAMDRLLYYLIKSQES